MIAVRLCFFVIFLLNTVMCNAQIELPNGVYESLDSELLFINGDSIAIIEFNNSGLKTALCTAGKFYLVGDTLKFKRLLNSSDFLDIKHKSVNHSKSCIIRFLDSEKNPKAGIYFELFDPENDTSLYKGVTNNDGELCMNGDSDKPMKFPDTMRVNIRFIDTSLEFDITPTDGMLVITYMIPNFAVQIVGDTQSLYLIEITSKEEILFGRAGTVNLRTFKFLDNCDSMKDFFNHFVE